VKTEETPRELSRRLAEAKTDHQLDRFLEDYIASEVTREVRERWRNEQEHIALAWRHLDRAAQPPIRPARPKQQGFRRASVDRWWAENSENRPLVFRALAKLISGGLRRTTLVRLTDDCKAIEPEPRTLAGVCWIQVAMAAKALAHERQEKSCQQCGAKFSPKRKSGKRAVVKFCSSKCRMAHYYARRQR
jgi:hypothetical protein